MPKIQGSKTAASKSESTDKAARKARPTNIPAEESMLDLSQAGALLGMSRSTLYRRARSDENFPALVRFGTRCTRVRAGDLLRWAASHEAR
jgi:predicted DNA-binding transcriptional regulator AlpA